MLTGRESLAAAVAAVSHRRRDAPAVSGGAEVLSWARLGADVRLVALGLIDRGVETGNRATVTGADGRDRRSLVLAVLAVGAVLAQGAPEIGAGDLNDLRRRGRALDERRPSRFEEAWGAVAADDTAADLDGFSFTHDALLRATRSLAQALGAGPDDRVLCTSGGPLGLVAGVLLPVVTGGAAVPAGAVVTTVAEARPTLMVIERPEALALAAAAQPVSHGGGWRPGRRRRGRPDGMDGCRAAIVVDDDTSAAARLRAAGAPAHAGLVVDGIAGVVTALDGSRSLGSPLPGVTVAIDDEGQVCLRAPGAASGADRWLCTGRRGTLESGRLLLDPVAS